MLKRRQSRTFDLDGDRVAQAGGGRSAARARLSHYALHLAERFLLLVLGDLMVLMIALRLALLVRQDQPLLQRGVAGQLTWMLVLALTWGMLVCLLGTYEQRCSPINFRSLCVVAGTAGAAGIVFTLIPFLSPPLPVRRLDVAFLPLLAGGGIGAWRWAYTSVLAQPSFHRRALIVSTIAAAEYLAASIDGSGQQSGYRLIGLVAVAPPLANDRPSTLPMLGGPADLSRLLGHHRPDELVVAMPQDPVVTDCLLPAILAAQESGIRITTMTRVYEQLTGRLALQQVGQRFDLVLPLSVGGSQRLYLALRRVIEVGISLCGCMLTIVLLPAVWVANRCFSPGPLFFRQERVGKGSKCFNIVKFRSMVADAEKQAGAVWAVEADPRITRVGRFLRMSRIDELPQFWNVLKGEMSLIGPRPERPIFVEQLERAIPYYRVRHSVRPGLTGWAQVKYGYASSVDDSLTKLQYDLYYIKHHHALLDLLIILRTVQMIVGLRGR